MSEDLALPKSIERDNLSLNKAVIGRKSPMKIENNTSRLFRPLSALLLALPLSGLTAFGVQTAYASGRSLCDQKGALCTEALHSPYDRNYTGHDEPSLLFYSNVPGSGIPMFTSSPCPRILQTCLSKMGLAARSIFSSIQ